MYYFIQQNEFSLLVFLIFHFPCQIFTELPGAPEDLDIGQITQWSVSLFWRKPVNDGGSPITGYAIEQSIGNAAWNEITQIEGSAHSYNVRDLQENVETFYRIRAKNAAGWGDYRELLRPVTPKKAPSK